MGDWLDINGWVKSGWSALFDALFTFLDSTFDTTLMDWHGGFSNAAYLFSMCAITFTLIMLTLPIVVLWTERKFIARLMDHRGATTTLRSLWVGERGVTAGEWWNMVPFGLGKPIGYVVKKLNKIAGNRSSIPAVDRANDRSWHGVPFLFPGFFQNLADGAKFLTKEHMVPAKADKWIFELAPFLIISSTVVILGFLPFGENIYAANPELSVLFAFAVFGVAPLGVFFAGWSSNNKYTLLGGIRSAAQLTAYEIPLLITVLAVCVLSGSLNLIEVINFQHQSGSWNIFLLPLGGMLFLITMVAEVERIPFDMPEAEAELVEGWWTEYGGLRWGLLFAAEYLRCYAACILMAHFFLGGFYAPFASTIGSIPYLGTAWLAIPGLIWVVLKAWFIFALFVWARAALPRIRTDQILEFGWRYLLPLSMVNLVMAFALRLYVYDGAEWSIFVPLIITVIGITLFVILSIDEDPEAKRPSHTVTMQPAGKHVPGED